MLFIAINDFGNAVAFEVKDARTRRSTGIIDGFAVCPEDLSAIGGTVVAVNDIIIPRGDADIRSAIFIEVSNDGGSGS